MALNTVIGFTNKSLHASVSQLLDGPYSVAQMTHDLRKVRLKGLITRIPHTNSYTLTPEGAPHVSSDLFFDGLPGAFVTLGAQGHIPDPIRKAVVTARNSKLSYSQAPINGGKVATLVAMLVAMEPHHHDGLRIGSTRQPHATYRVRDARPAGKPYHVSN